MPIRANLCLGLSLAFSCDNLNCRRPRKHGSAPLPAGSRLCQASRSRFCDALPTDAGGATESPDHNRHRHLGRRRRQWYTPERRCHRRHRHWLNCRLSTSPLGHPFMHEPRCAASRAREVVSLQGEVAASTTSSPFAEQKTTFQHFGAAIGRC